MLGPRDSAASITIPARIPYAPSENEIPNGERRTEYVLCREEIVSKLAALDSTKPSKLYLNIFKAIWNQGVLVKKVSVQIAYYQMTLPWLRNPVVFIYGPGRSISLPYVKGLLPNKNQVKAHGGKIVAVAIFDTWMRREKSVSKFIRTELLGPNIDLPHASVNECRKMLQTGQVIPPQRTTADSIRGKQSPAVARCKRAALVGIKQAFNPRKELDTHINPTCVSNKTFKHSLETRQQFATHTCTTELKFPCCIQKAGSEMQKVQAVCGLSKFCNFSVMI